MSGAEIGLAGQETEVTAKALRRQFTAEYKRKVLGLCNATECSALEFVDACSSRRWYNSSNRVSERVVRNSREAANGHMAITAPSGSLRVHELALDRAIDLFDCLNPAAGLFVGGHLFRGQADSTWGLVPSVFRHDVPFLLPESRFPRDTWVYGSQVRLELELLWLFVARANEAGLTIPGDNAVRDLLDRTRLDGHWVTEPKNLRSWPPPELIPAMALAQHHGVPTRLLDWTYSPHAAMYFAAEGAARKDSTESRLAVWVCSLAPDRRSVTGAPSAEISRPSNASNPNLRAQRGCLMIWRKGIRADDPFERAPLEKQLSYEADRAGRQGPPIFYKLTLPRKESGPLLQLLSLNQIDGATLFPGFDGVARVVRERVFWTGFKGTGGSDPDAELGPRQQALVTRFFADIPVFKSQHCEDDRFDGDYSPVRQAIFALRAMLDAGDHIPRLDREIESLQEALADMRGKAGSMLVTEVEATLEALRGLL